MQNEILLFATTWMNPMGIMLNEISETNTVWVLSYVKPKEMKQMNKPNSRLVDNREQTCSC